MKQAIIYLRVSTKEQAERDGDPEGYSLPAQREACRRKAEGLGAVVIDEYVDRGESAKTSDRPALQAMLRRVSERRDIDYLIVHKVDRLARNRTDDVAISVELQAAGVTLVSCTESIDETPSGKLLHGIMASIAEFYSRNLANEVMKGTRQKVERGGTPYLAPLGYLNVHVTENGRSARTIAIDPERGPLIREAFELYATGDWTLRTLLEELTARGLTTRPNKTRPPGRVHLSKFSTLLRNPYYMGLVRYAGETYVGKHDPLISVATFERVQQLLDAHRLSGERHWKYQHYLKGSVLCGRCGRRLTFMNARGRHGGIYPYFFCMGRQHGTCDLPYVSVDGVEERVAAEYRSRRLTAEQETRLRREVSAELKQSLSAVIDERQRLNRRLARIESQRHRLSEHVLDGAIPPDIGRTKQAELAAALLDTQQRLRQLPDDGRAIESVIGQLLDVAAWADTAYQLAEHLPDVRRLLNQALFESFLVDIDEDGVVSLAAEETPPYRELRRRVRSRATARPAHRRAAPRGAATAPRHEEAPDLVGVVRGSNDEPVVGDEGLEPPTLSV